MMPLSPDTADYFSVGTELVPVVVLRTIATLKRLAAQTNAELGLLEPNVANAIGAAAAEIEADDAERLAIGLWRAGCGNTWHSAVNERIARRASALSGLVVDAFEHVNLGQSTNDVVPAAMHVATLSLLDSQLMPALDELCMSYDEAIERCQGVLKPGRTYLQDAHPMWLSSELSAHRRQITNAKAQLDAVRGRLEELAIGGTAVGTGLGSHPAFAGRVSELLSSATNLRLRPARNLFEAVATHDALAAYSAVLALLATSCLKITNDIQLLASGPRCGVADIVVPANEPGSTTMGGKVNPTQAVLLANVSVRVIGNHHAVTLAAAGGVLQLNTYKPLIIDAVIQSTALMADACRSFGRHCVAGIAPNQPQLDLHRATALSFSSALKERLGYAGMERVVTQALAKRCSLIEVVSQELGISGSDLECLIERAATPLHPESDV